MIKNISERLTGVFVGMSIISEDDRESYIFCFEVLLFDMISFLTVVLMAVLFNRIVESVVYLLAFAFLRLNAGGFHAKTHLGCFMTLCLTYIAFVVLITVIPSGIYGYVSLVSVVLSFVSIVTLAPLEHVNRKLTAREFIACRRRCRIIAAILSTGVIIGTLTLHTDYHVFIVSTSLGMLTIALSLLVVKIKKSKEERA